MQLTDIKIYGNKNKISMENKKKNIEITETGLQCDNPTCDWTDTSIKFETYKEWLNKPCPKCGQNVLTEEDYKNAETLRVTVDYINSLPEEQVLKIVQETGLTDITDLTNHPMFSNTKGVENLLGDNSEEAIMTISTHKEIKVEEIKKVNNENNK